MKLVIATPLYPPEPGGPATYAKLLEEGLPAHGIDVSLVKFSDVRRFPKMFRHFAYKGMVKKALRDADAVLALDPVSVGYPAMLAARELGKPLFVKIVGDYAWEQGTQRFGITSSLDEFVMTERVPFPVRMLRSIETGVARAARKIIVPSQYLARIVAAWGVPAEKIAVIYNAPRDLGAHGSYARPEDAPPGPYVVSIARLVPWKGMDGAMRALARARKERPDLSLVIVGDGPEEERLKTLAATLGITDAVRFVGRKPQGEAPAYLSHAEALILNTGYEGFSHLILESFLLGVPVITTPVGGNVEQVEDGQTGLLFPYQDDAALALALSRLLGDPTLRARIVEGAKARLAGFGGREALLESVANLLRT